MPQSVYVHIPFCEHICPYCDFNKFVLKGQPIMDYLRAVKMEMQESVRRWPPQQPIQTIFVGGGTPTALNEEQMTFFLRSLQDVYGPFAHTAEFTMEANPGTVDEQKLAIMRAYGVNRVSFGVQSFEPLLLRSLGRIHDRQQVFQSIESARRAGFENISIDLMFGLPNQTPAMFARTIETALSLNLPHFSAYSLKIEEGTHFHSLAKQNRLPLPAEDEEADMYEMIIERLCGHGYEHYEISNFARPGWESRHNMTYWLNKDYYGIGAGAHGLVNGTRHENAGPLEQYIDAVHQTGLARIHEHRRTQRETMEDHLIMGLRTRKGIDRSAFRTRFGDDIEDIFKQEVVTLTAKGLLECASNRYRLTRAGILFGNEVFSTFLALHD